MIWISQSTTAVALPVIVDATGGNSAITLLNANIFSQRFYRTKIWP
jgi:hypothetical protein